MDADDSLPTILLVDADSLARRALERCLRASRFDVRAASRADAALSLIETVPLCLAIAAFDDGAACDGVLVLRELRARQPTCGRVLIADAVVRLEIAAAAQSGVCHVVLQRPFAIAQALAYASTARPASPPSIGPSASMSRVSG